MCPFPTPTPAADRWEKSSLQTTQTGAEFPAHTGGPVDARACASSLIKRPIVVPASGTPFQHTYYGSMGLDAAERFLLLPATARTLENIVLKMRFPPPAQLTRRKKTVERPAPNGMESRPRRAHSCCRRACYSCALSLSSLPPAKALSNIRAAATSGNSPQSVGQRQ